MTKGLVTDLDSGACKVSFDKGYSFCNCHDIFYTKKENLDPTVYNEDYFKKYQCDDIESIAKFEIERIYKLMRSLRPKAKSIFEVGAVTDTWMDFLKDKGYEVSGMDIINHESKHSLVVDNFEKWEPFMKYDVVLASHIFEHFLNPEKALEKFSDLLNPDGIIYIAMPDTYLIEWENPLNWDWNVQEHHILWNMDSFIEYCEGLGWKCIYSLRPLDLHEQKKSDWFWKREFQVILCRK